MRLLAGSLLVLAAAIVVSALLLVRTRHDPVQVQIKPACADTFWGCGGSVYAQRP